MQDRPSYESIDFLEGREAILNAVSMAGPYRILDILKGLSPTQQSELYDDLRQPDHFHVLSQMMYFMKYILDELPVVGRQIEQIALKAHADYKRIAGDDALPFALSRFSDDELELVLSNIRFIQFSYGCPGCCNDHCGVDAVYGLKDRIPIGHQLTFLDRHRGKTNPTLHWADDFLLHTKSIEEFFEFAEKFFQYISPLSFKTSIPFGSDDLYREVCTSQMPFLMEVSLHEYNIPSLKDRGILRVDTLDEMYGRDYQSIFSPGCMPHRVKLYLPNEFANVGMNHWNISGNNRAICGNGLVLTPFGLYNSILMPQATRDYPQGLAIVAVKSLSGDSVIHEITSLEELLSHNLVDYDAPLLGHEVGLANMSGVRQVNRLAYTLY